MTIMNTYIYVSNIWKRVTNMPPCGQKWGDSFTHNSFSEKLGSGSHSLRIFSDYLVYTFSI